MTPISPDPRATGIVRGDGHDQPAQCTVDRSIAELPVVTRDVHVALLASLPGVATDLLYAKSVDEILLALADQSLLALGAGSVVACLVDDSAEDVSVDPSSMFIRGKRRRDPELWRERIESVGRVAFCEAIPQLVRIGPTSMLCVPISAQNRPIGLLAAIGAPSAPISEQTIMLLAVLAAFAGPAIENARMVASERFASLMRERERISKEMHDGLAQTLFSVSLGLELCKGRLLDHPVEVAARLETTQTLVREGLSELRACIYDLQPPSLAKLGLAGSIARRMREVSDGQGVETSFSVKGEPFDLDPGAEVCVYRIAQEAISNSARHSGAGRISVVLTYGQRRVTVRVADDGRGFEVDRAGEPGRSRRSLGLDGIRQRAEAEGGTVLIASSPDGGTTVEVSILCDRRR